MTKTHGEGIEVELSEFGHAAAAYDHAEETGDHEGMDVRWVCVMAMRPETAWDWRWVARMIARSRTNDWTDEAAAPLLRLAM